MRTATAIFALALGSFALLAVACGSSGPATTATVSAGCAPPRPHDPGAFHESLTSAGLEREYRLYVPSSYSGVAAVPLVLNLHGLGSSAGQQAVYSGLQAKAEEAGFIAVAPQGTGVLPHWNLTPGQRGEADDVAFISDLLDALESQLCVDPARVYATGMSNGAMMSVRLACDLSDRIAAIAPVAGVYFPRSCPSRRPVPLIAFHGTDDRLVPFEGGEGTSQLGGLLAPVEESVGLWARHNGCAGDPQRGRVAEHVRLVRYDDCNEGATVELYVVEGGGHTWPGAEVGLPLGATSREISARDLMWTFFQAHPRP